MIIEYVLIVLLVLNMVVRYWENKRHERTLDSLYRRHADDCDDAAEDQREENARHEEASEANNRVLQIVVHDHHTRMNLETAHREAYLREMRALLVEYRALKGTSKLFS